MTGIRRILLGAAIMAAAVLAPTEAKAQNEISNLGVKIGYVSKNHGMMVGAFYQYAITDNVRIAPEIGLLLRNRDLSSAMLDLNLHFPLNFGTPDCDIYPIAGLNLTNWRVHNLPHDLGEVSKTYSRLGANLGAGFEYYTKRNIKVRVEIKTTLTSKYTTVVYDAGVAYMF